MMGFFAIFFIYRISRLNFLQFGFICYWMRRFNATVDWWMRKWDRSSGGLRKRLAWIQTG